VSIYIGLSGHAIEATVNDYLQAHPHITQVYIFNGMGEPLTINAPCEQFTWADAITYEVYYPLLAKVNNNTLIIINNMLRTSDRYCLTYNCLRQYLTRTKHRLVFNAFPVIRQFEDLAILADFALPANVKGLRFEEMQLPEIHVTPKTIALDVVAVKASSKTRADYEQARETLFAQASNSLSFDVHNIPRRLSLVAQKERQAQAVVYVMGSSKQMIGRGKGCINPASLVDTGDLVVVDPPISDNDFITVLMAHTQKTLPWLVCDLPVDHYYFTRYQDTLQAMETAYDRLTQI